MKSMFCELEPEGFESVRPLFGGLGYHLMTVAALEGRRRARGFGSKQMCSRGGTTSLPPCLP